MKKLIFSFALLSIIISNVSFSANELWRSRISGSWTTPSTWEFSTNGGSIWIIATSTFPEVTSSTTTIRNPNAVTVNDNTPLAIDQFTIESGASLTLGSGSRLFINDGGGTDLSLFGAVSGPGSIKPFGASVTFDVRNSSSFLAPLVLDSGSVNIVNPDGPFIANLRGAISISTGQTLTVNAGGYTVRAFGTVTNSGVINGNGSSFTMRGSNFVNTGNISVTSFNFDSTTLLDGNGIWNSSAINFNSTGNVTINDTVVFGGANVVNVNVNNQGVVDGAGQYLLLDGTTATVNLTVNANGKVGNSNTTNVHTRGNVSINVRNSGIFNASLNIKTGTTNCVNSDGPFISVFNGPIVIDAGATQQVNPGGYTVQARSNVTNNGTISGSGSAFTMRGANFTNNSIINVTIFNFDSTTALVGAGTWGASTVNIGSSGNVIISGNNVSFGAAAVVNFNINSGGRLNPNSRTVTMNGSVGSVNFTINNGGNTSPSGIIQTRGTVGMNFRNGSNFNSALRVNTGQTTGFNTDNPFIGNLFNTITIDAAAILTTLAGGYTIQANNNVTNNGTINASGSAFIMTGNNFTNNGIVTPSTFNFSDTTSVSGGGTWNPSTLNINSNAVVSLSNNVAFGGSGPLTFNILSNGSLNPNTFTGTLMGSLNTVTLNINSAGSVLNSGVLQTQGIVNLNLRNGSQFFTPFKANTGTATFYNDNNPFEAVVNSTITIDTGAGVNVLNGGFSLRANENVTNNGTISGSGSAFNFWSQNFINNGIVNVANFIFKGILFSPTYSHTISGTGKFTTSNCIVEDGGYVAMTSDHQFSYLTVNSGGTFDLNGNTLKLFGAGVPITVNGFLLTAGSTVEYNGTASQTLASTNVEYENLIINDTSGVICSANFSIPGSLQIINGDLDLNGKIINMTTTGVLTETPGNTVKGNSGYLVATRNINAPNNLNVAGLGAQLTTTSDLGLTEIRRAHTVQTLPSGTQSIKRLFTIKPVNNSALNATLIFHYDESELNGLPENGIRLFQSTNAGSSYSFEGGTLNTTLNRITKNNINSFSRYTAGGSLGNLNITAAPEGFYNLTTLRLNSRDTIRVKLRNNNSPYNVIDSAKGVFDSVTLVTNLTFLAAQSDTYYVSINHRNSIETWSKTNGLIYNVGSTQNYNFTTAPSQAYGNNITLTGTKWLIFSGDVNQNGTVDATDLSLVDNDAANFVTGYVPTDVTGNYVTDAEDLAITDNNAFDFVSKVTPP